MANPTYASPNFSTTLNVGGGINNSQTTGIVLTSVSGLNTNGGILGIDWASTIDTSTYEEIEYTGITGNELTGVIRGVNGFSAHSHNNLAVIVNVVSSIHNNRIADKLTSRDATLAQDPNGNEIIKTSYNASAVNEVTVINAATGNAPSINATGSDTDIDLSIAGKGAGKVKFGTAALKLPNADGTNGQVLQTNGSAVLSFATVSISTDGWTSDSHTWVYASASTFTISGVDLTGTFTTGTYLRFKQGGGYKYAIVASSSFSTNTTVTIFVNTDYTIANSSITDNYYSYQANPQGYPGWFNYTPTYTGFSSAPTGTGHARFVVIGRTCTVMKTSVTVGTSNATGFTFTLPVACNAVAANPGVFICRAIDNGTTNTSTSAVLTASSNVVTLEKTSGAPASWTNSGNKDVYITLAYEI